MKAYLAAHGVKDGEFYTHGDLGAGEIDGIEEIEGVWQTYFSERGSKNSYRQWPSEEEAVDFIMRRARHLARAMGAWHDTAEKQFLSVRGVSPHLPEK